MVRTVLGDISPEMLRNTQCHEHLFIAKGKPFEINPDLYMDDMEKILRELSGYKEAGGSAVVDAQPVFCGRMAEKLVIASKNTDLHIISVTGFHKTVFYDDGGFPFGETVETLTELFESEVTKGLTGTNGKRLDNRAGLIKAAVDKGGIFRDRIYEMLFEAAANAALMTGAPILVHTEKGADVLEIINYFSNRGIKPYRIILCHVDRTNNDARLHREVLSTGAYLCYDSINRLKYLSHEEEISLIISMLEAGYGKQLLLSLDTTRARLSAYGADMGLDYIHKEFIPMLLKRGVSTGDIKMMISENASKALQIIK